MREVSGIAVDHVVIQSSRSYEAVKTALEQRLGTLGWQLATKRGSWDEIVARSGSSSGHAVSVSSVRSNRASHSPWPESAERQFVTPSDSQRGRMGLMTNVRRTFDVPYVPYELFPVQHRFLDLGSLSSTTSTRARRDALTVTRQSRLVFPLSEDHSCCEARFPMCCSRLSRYGMSGAPAGYGFTPGEHTLVFGRSANKPGVPDNNTRSTISSFVCLSRAYIVLYSSLM